MGYFRKFVLSPATFGAFKFRSKGEKAEIERRKQTELLEQMQRDQAYQIDMAAWALAREHGYTAPPPQPPKKKPSWWNNYNR